jgi:hypothetical protein
VNALNRKEKPKGDKNQNGKPPKKPAVIVRIFREIERQYHVARDKAEKREAERAKYERMTAIWTRRLGLWTMGLAGIALVTAAIFYCTMKGAETSSERQLRAYVFFDAANLVLRPWQPNIPKPDRLSIDVNIANNGATWGSHFAAYATIIWQPPDNHSDPFDAVNWNSMLRDLGTVAPKQNMIFNVGVISADEMKELQPGGTRRAYAVGLLRYIDVVSSHPIVHQSQMLLRISVDGDGLPRYDLMGKHNCSDDDCTSRNDQEAGQAVFRIATPLAVNPDIPVPVLAPPKAK